MRFSAEISPVVRDYLRNSGYTLPGQTAEERYVQIAENAARRAKDEAFGERLLGYMEKNWFGPSTPVLANYGAPRALPIACFGSVMDDSMDSIIDKTSEIFSMTRNGGGTSLYLGNIRPKGSKVSTGGKASGGVSYARIIDTGMDVIAQSSVRKGACAVYLPIESPDFWDFMRIRDKDHPIHHLHFGVTIRNNWMEQLKKDIANEVETEIIKRWLKVLEKRAGEGDGEPYVIFIDNMNNGAPEWYKGLILHSNLCTEIALPNSAEESFVCCLSSGNLLFFDEWKDTLLVPDSIRFLDTVLDEFIEKAEDDPTLRAAVRFARRHRAIGFGVLGWHSYLQSKGLPWDSMEAYGLNHRVFKEIQRQAVQESRRLASIYGEPEAIIGSGQRHGTLLAVAPTTSNAFLSGNVSQGIEPLKSNYFIKDLRGAVHSWRNPYLNLTEAEWAQVLEDKGSVQNIASLSQREKEVFKTFSEINPYALVRQTAQRQKFIDQGQSFNVIFSHDAEVADISDLYIHAWEEGVKALYYQRGVSAVRAAKLSPECVACEG